MKVFAVLVKIGKYPFAVFALCDLDTESVYLYRTKSIITLSLIVRFTARPDCQCG